jgi:hypothetical protein
VSVAIMFAPHPYLIDGTALHTLQMDGRMAW